MRLTLFPELEGPLKATTVIEFVIGCYNGLEYGGLARHS
jgi:hypothetical protein